MSQHTSLASASDDVWVDTGGGAGAGHWFLWGFRCPEISISGKIAKNWTINFFTVWCDYKNCESKIKSISTKTIDDQMLNSKIKKTLPSF